MDFKEHDNSFVIVRIPTFDFESGNNILLYDQIDKLWKL